MLSLVQCGEFLTRIRPTDYYRVAAFGLSQKIKVKCMQGLT